MSPLVLFAGAMVLGIVGAVLEEQVYLAVGLGLMWIGVASI